MTDDPFYAPSHKASAPAPPRLEELLWSLRKGDLACAVLAHGEQGIETAPGVAFVGDALPAFDRPPVG